MSECTRGMEFMCAAAVNAKCQCACHGKNHGKFRYLKTERDAKGPWSASEARRQLALAQERRRQQEIEHIEASAPYL